MTEEEKEELIRGHILDHLSSDAVEFMTFVEDEDIPVGEDEDGTPNYQLVYEGVIAKLGDLAQRYEDEEN